MVLPKAQIEDNADATIVRAQMHLQELQVVDVDRICKQVGARHSRGVSCVQALGIMRERCIDRQACLRQSSACMSVCTRRNPSAC